MWKHRLDHSDSLGTPEQSDRYYARRAREGVFVALSIQGGGSGGCGLKFPLMSSPQSPHPNLQRVILKEQCTDQVPSQMTPGEYQRWLSENHNRIDAARMLHKVALMFPDEGAMWKLSLAWVDVGIRREDLPVSDSAAVREIQRRLRNHAILP